jgi:flagellar hook-length control protein FliK
VDTVKTDTVTVDTVNTDTVTTDTAQKPVTASPDLGRQQDGASANPGDTGQNFQKPDDGERSRQFTRVERPGFDPSRVDPEINADMKATEPAQVAQNEPQASSMVEGVRINPAMSNDIQPAVEVAESPGAGKTERVEVNARLASETVRKIQDAVMRTSVNNIGAMRLDLSSPETGNLEVAVRLDNDGQVDVRVMAGSGELRDMISRELPQLRSALGEQNLSLRDFEAREWAGQQDFRGFANGRGDQRGDARDNGRGVTGAAGVNSRGVPIKALNDQMGRQALRSFRVVDLSDRSLGGPGRIKVLA